MHIYAYLMTLYAAEAPRKQFYTYQNWTCVRGSNVVHISVPQKFCRSTVRGHAIAGPLCMYVCMYVCMSASVWQCRHVCKHVCMHICMCMYVCVSFMLISRHGKQSYMCIRLKKMPFCWSGSGQESITTLQGSHSIFRQHVGWVSKSRSVICGCTCMRWTLYPHI